MSEHQLHSGGNEERVPWRLKGSLLREERGPEGDLYRSWSHRAFSRCQLSKTTVMHKGIRMDRLCLCSEFPNESSVAKGNPLKPEQ